MELFAHHGIDHSTIGEAAAHSASDTIAITLFVTIAVALLAGSAVYLTNRFALKKSDTKDKAEE